MATKKSNQPAARLPDLVGEGARVPTTIEHISNEGGLVTARAKIDLSNAPAPSRKFVADCFEVRVEFTEARMLFGQRQVDGVTVRAILDVRYPPEAVSGVLELLRGLRAANGAPAENVFETHFTSEPEQAIAVQANFMRMNAGGSATTIDLYHASGIALSRFAGEGFLHAEPVVRISMPNRMIGEFSAKAAQAFAHFEVLEK